MPHRLRSLTLLACLAAAAPAARGQSLTAHPRYPQLIPQIGLRLPHCLAVSPGGGWMAVIGGDVFSGATLELIDLREGFVLRDSPVDGFPCPMAASRDGRWLALAGPKDGTVVLDAREWRQVAAFSTAPVGFSPDGSLLILYDPRKGELHLAATSTWKEAPGPAIAELDFDAPGTHPLVAFASDSRTLVAVQRDCSAPVWPCQAKVKIATVAMAGAPPPASAPSELRQVCGIAMDPGRDRFLLWGDIRQGRAAAELRRTADLGLDWSGTIPVGSGARECDFPPVLGPAGDWIAAPQLDSNDAATTVLRPSAGTSVTQADALALSGWPGHDGALLAQLHPGSLATTLLGYTPADAAVRPLLQGENDVTQVLFPPDGAWMATAGSAADGQADLRVWDLGSSGAVTTLPDTYGPTIAMFTPDARTLAFLRPGGPLNLHSLAGEPERVLDAAITPLAISPDGETLVGSGPGSAPGTVRIMLLRGQAPARAIGGDRASGSFDGAAAVADDAQCTVLIPRIRSGSSFHDGSTAEIYDAAGGLERKLPLRIPPDHIGLSPDGRWLVVQYQLTGEVWDLDSPNPKPHFSFNAWASPAAFSPDSRLLLAPPGDLWELASTRRVARFPGMSNAPAVFSPDGHWILTLDVGGMNLWSVAERRLRATLQTFADGSWLVATPEGLFDGSPDALGHARWRFSDRLRDVAPLEIFLNEDYHPGLLPEILRGGDPRPEVAIDAVDRRQPRVGLALAAGDAATPQARTVTVRLTLQAAAPGFDPVSGKRYAAPSGIRDVRLFRNGTLIREWHGEQKPGTLRARVTLTAGANHLTAYGFSDAGIKSVDADLQLTGRRALARRGAAYILAIGINRYGAAAELPTLRFAVADAHDAAATLENSLRGVGSYQAVTSQVLANGAATRAGIEAAFRSLAARVQPEDTVIVTYAGHGVARGDRFYLLPSDLDRAAFEAGRWAASRAVSDRDLEAWLEPIAAAHLLLVLDACDSGAAIGPAAQRIGPLNSSGLGELAFEKGLDILAASQAAQSANENSRLGHGLLTYALLQEGIEQGKAAVADRVEVRHWLEYTASEVPLLMQQILEARAHTRGFPGDLAAARAPLQYPRYYFRREPDVTPFLVAAKQP